jgi:hypothetical protein
MPPLAIASGNDRSCTTRVVGTVARHSSPTMS